MVKINAIDRIAEMCDRLEIDSCDAVTGWTVLGNDTTGNGAGSILATDLNHIWGTASIDFNKVNGAANTIFAGIQKTITSLDIDSWLKNGMGYILWSLDIPDLTNVAYAFVRLGTSSSHYNEWRVDDSDLIAGWNALKAAVSNPTSAGNTGNGWNPAAITYAAVGVAFDGEANTLADMKLDRIYVVPATYTSADIITETSTSVSTGDINLEEVAGSTVSAGAGAVAAGTQRVTLASDDPAVAKLGTIDTDTGAIATSVAAIPAKGTAAMAASTPVTLASDDVIALAIKTALELIDNDNESRGQTIVYADIPITALSADTATQLIALVAAKKFYILELALTCNTQTYLRVLDTTTTPVYRATYQVAARGGIVLGRNSNDKPHFVTTAAQNLGILADDACSVSGHIVYYNAA